MSDRSGAAPFEGRCHCGASVVGCAGAPDAVTYWHRGDCRRIFGEPVTRWSCTEWGNQLGVRFAEPLDQIRVSLGSLDRADELPLTGQANIDCAVPSIQIAVTLLRAVASAQARLARHDG